MSRKSNLSVTINGVTINNLTQEQVEALLMAYGTKDNKPGKNAPEQVNIEDYKPTGWGNGKKGYTTMRKAYSYAVCKAETGKNYDEEVYKKASEEFKARYYNEME